MRIPRALALAALVCSLFAPAHALDRHAFAFPDTRLRVMVNTAGHAISATGTVEVRNISGQPQRDVSLQISSSLEWKRVLLGEEELSYVAAGYTTDMDHTGVFSEAVVRLPEPLAPGASTTLRVEYEGTIEADGTRLAAIGAPADVAARSEWDQLAAQFAAVRGIGYVAWYPVQTEAASLSNGSELYDEIARWKSREAGASLQVTFLWSEGDKAEPIRLVTNGEVQPASEKPAEGRAITAVAFKASEVPVFVLAPFATQDRESSVVYYLAPHLNSAREFAVSVERTAPLLEDWLGKPHRKVVIVDLANTNALPYDAGSILFLPLQHNAEGALDTALARTIAHACFSSPRPWINEGLAGLAQAIVREREYGRRAAVTYLNQFADALATADRPGAKLMPAAAEPAPGDASQPSPVIAPQPLTQTSDQLFFRTKATFVWWMLRDTLDDDALRGAIASYRAADDHEPSYMQRLIESRIGKRSLEQFFDDWVYRDRGLPDFSVESVNVRKLLLNNEYVVAVTVQNLGGAGAEVPVVVRSLKGERVGRVEVPAHSKATVRIPTSDEPTEVTVNDGSVPEGDVSNNSFRVESPSK